MRYLGSRGFNDCLQSLNTSDSESCRENLLFKRNDDTCTWLLEDLRYIEWVGNESKTTLWIHGGPGCGKSVLSAFLSEELCRSSSLKCYLVIYFFCDDKDERLRSGQKVLTNLLAQILKQCPKALIHFSAESEYNIFREKTSWTFGMLWRVFDRI